MLGKEAKSTVHVHGGVAAYPPKRSHSMQTHPQATTVREGRRGTDLVDNDHVKVAQVEADSFQVDNGNSRHGYDCRWGLNKLH